MRIAYNEIISANAHRVNNNYEEYHIMARAKDIIRNVVGGLSRLISIVALIAVFVLSFLLIRSIMQTKETQQLTATLQTIRERPSRTTRTGHKVCWLSTQITRAG